MGEIFRDGMTGHRPDDLDRLAADPSDPRLVKLALTAAAREIAFLRSHATLPPLPGPPAGWSPAVANGRKAITKTHADRLIWAGTTAEQAFCIELACLSRLSLTPGAVHFPAVLAADASARSLTMAHAGLDLPHIDQRGRPVMVPDPQTQIARILDAMAAAGVVHLDLQPDGRNLCVSDAGHLTLIDFDIAALDGQCHSGAIAERLAALQSSGNLRSAMATQIETALTRCRALRRG